MNSPVTGSQSRLQEQTLDIPPAGFLFYKSGLLVLLAGLLLAAWAGQIAIVIILGLFLSAAVFSGLWSRWSLAGVSYERHLSEHRAFPGEHIDLKLRLVNRKPLPLPWIQIDDALPLKLASDIRLAPSNSPAFGLLSKSAALLWYTGANWKERLHCHKRGYYQIGPVTLTSGDLFGFYPRAVTISLVEHVIVYPKIFPLTHLGIPSLHPLGELTAERRIFADPLRVIGVRDYNPRDSRRHIHWKATARRQELQVKVFDPTTTLKTAIFLAVDSFKSRQGEISGGDDFELGISTAASIASYLTERRSAVGLLVNSCLADSGQPAILLPGSSPGQLVEILEALAKVTPTSSSPFATFLQGERTTLSWGTTLIFILAEASPPLLEQLESLRESGHKLVVFQIGDAAAKQTVAGIPWHEIQYPDDFTKASAEVTA